MLLALGFILWLSAESKVEKINRINSVIDSHMMFGKTNEAYQFLQQELTKGAPLQPNWLYLLKYEPDLNIKLDTLLNALRSNPDQEHTYLAIKTAIQSNTNITQTNTINNFLLSLSSVKGINQQLLNKYDLTIPKP